LITKKDVVMVQWLTPNAKDLLKGLLNRDPKKRLGNKGIETIKTHPFFEEINWEALEKREVDPPFVP
jgi:serum/glucocorticoid-regulated kinase 2